MALITKGILLHPYIIGADLLVAINTEAGQYLTILSGLLAVLAQK